MSALEIHQTIAFQDYLKREMKRLRFSTGLLSRRVGSLTCATCNIWDDAIARCYAAASGAEDVGQIPSSLAIVLMVIYRMQGRPQLVCCYQCALDTVLNADW
ncbi:hypothetical protein I4F81_000327 [Pyropia yezoensis]|uniref:Uncharacterized protein n=1 Tax=Pyropia yezoensis TaxID=2788 RepID=A0ACC3BJP0_PYRYE|nr:hypothetical protein I4F81_000327 [Neopyropia yezoensis]